MLLVKGIDIGLSGAISDGLIHTKMPIILTEVKPAVTVLIKDAKGRKQYYKSGPLAGQPKFKIKTPAVYDKSLDVRAILNLIRDCDVVVIESQGTTLGNSAASSRTTSINFGKILACAELTQAKIVTIAPHKWKADLKLSKDKLDSVIMAETLTGQSFRTSQGALLDGQAEAFLIRHWYLTHYLKDQNV